MKTSLLALKIIKGHYGIDIAAVIEEVVTTYGIQDKVGAFQMDNATNNDIALDALVLTIPRVDRKQSRLRCFGHIINLIVKALLFGTDSTSL